MRHIPHLSVSPSATPPGESRKRLLRAVYTTVLFVALNYNLTTWVNSGFLSNFLAERNIGLVYAASAFITILVLMSASKLLRRLGGYHLTVFLLVLGVASALTLALAPSAWVAIPFFIAQVLVIQLANFDIDLF